MKNVLISMAVSSAILAGTAMAATPSAKFAATYTNDPMLSVRAMVTCDGTPEEVCQADANANGHTLATIKVP